MSCAAGGCNQTPTVLASSQDLPAPIAVDGINVYWGNTGPSGGTLMKCAVGGCAGGPTLVATGLAAPGAHRGRRHEHLLDRYPEQHGDEAHAEVTAAPEGHAVAQVGVPREGAVRPLGRRDDRLSSSWLLLSFCRLP